MRSLHQIGVDCGTDKATYHGYCDWYESHLGRLKSSRSKLVEIGVHRGASLRMWAAWLPLAEVVGIDISLAQYEGPGDFGDRICVIQADASIGSGAVVEAYRGADVIVDDGSHLGSQQIDAMIVAWPLLRPGGWYVIEDLQVMDEPTYRDANRPGIGEYIWPSIRSLMLDRGDLAECHVYRQIVFLRKAGQ